MDMQARPERNGFTLVEMLFALVLGLVISGSALSFAITTFRNVDGDRAREEVYRNARFVQMSLSRDVQYAGVGIESETRFGTVSTFSDTLVILSVPYDPTPAAVYEITTPVASTNPLPPGGTCGSLCIRFNKDAGGNFDMQPGDLARLQVNTERHLIVLTSVVDNTSTVDVSFLGDTTLLHYEAAFQGGLLLDNTTTFIQKLDPIVYFVTDSVLYRADAFDTLGVLQAAPIAYGVHQWDASLLFTDGDEAASANTSDSDFTNDFDDLLGVRITSTLGTNTPVRVAGGGTFTRQQEWVLTPRNLMYERNR